MRWKMPFATSLAGCGQLGCPVFLPLMPFGAALLPHRSFSLGLSRAPFSLPSVSVLVKICGVSRLPLNFMGSAATTYTAFCISCLSAFGFSVFVPFAFFWDPYSLGRAVLATLTLSFPFGRGGQGPPLHPPLRKKNPLPFLMGFVPKKHDGHPVHFIE